MLCELHRKMIKRIYNSNLCDLREANRQNINVDKTQELQIDDNEYL